MRRPLCVIGIVYVAAVWIMIFCRAGGGTVCDSLDREQIVAAGYVDWKEYRLSRGTRTPVIYLSDAIILKQSQVAVLEQFLSNSEKIPKQNLSKFWKENKEKLQREDAVEIKGIVCYMNEEDMPKMGSLVMVKGSYRAFLMPRILENSMLQITMGSQDGREGLRAAYYWHRAVDIIFFRKKYTESGNISPF